MYIHPFVCGVVCTVLTEVAGFIAYAIYCNQKNDKK